MLEILIDLTVILLLVATLALGIRLQRRLRSLRNDGGELRDLIGALGEAVGRAEAVLGELKRASIDHAERAEEDRRRGERLRDELGMLSGRADREADRLAELIGVARGVGRDRALPVPVIAAEGAADRVTPRPVATPPGSDRDHLERTLRSLR